MPAPRADLRSTLDTSRVHDRTVQRVDAVLDHIDQHLSDDLCLEVLARRAAMSPFHFHRLFRAWMGETLNHFVRRRRLETAAGRLRHCPDESVTAIALHCGFASPESLARAFRSHFGMTPSRWRAGGWKAWRQGPDASCAALACRVEVRYVEAAEYLCMRAHGDYAEAGPRLWERFLPWVHAMGLGDQPLAFVGLDDPAIAGPAGCHMEACVQVPPGWYDRAPLARHRRPARWVAALQYDGPSREIARGWNALLCDWLPGARYDMDEGHFFERYDPNQGTPGSTLVRCELCMPVQPRTSWTLA
jgi:AraC family transcriptional regulator